jgi:lipopolysaccharide/colanic/teichoic acid biosynthesis glycosyltransferase
VLPVLNEVLFQGTLGREQKRAERMDRALPVLLVSLEGGLHADAGPIWDRALKALSAATRETDVVGWVKSRSVVGVILTEGRSGDVALTSQVESRVRRILSTKFDPRTLERFSIGVEMRTDADTAIPEGRSAAHDIAKRAIDVAGSAALLAVLSPVFIVVAALIKLKSPGPVLFRQERVGQHARPFTMFKFRTMHVDNDAAIHQAYVSQFIQLGKESTSDAGTFKITNDPRVTRVGQVLRKTSIDELPQLLNVLRGEMSLVGPRPPIQYEVDKYKRWHRRRVLEAKPGMTGLWQVTGRSRTTFDEMVRLDLRYARKRSVWTDIKILLATPRAVIAGKGAC